MKESSIKVGVITDQTGPLSFMGIANTNVAKMVVDDINAEGGLLGHPIELFIEDSATEDAAAETAAMSEQERRFFMFRGFFSKRV